jgi:hypothetical protein
LGPLRDLRVGPGQLVEEARKLVVALASSVVSTVLVTNAVLEGLLQNQDQQRGSPGEGLERWDLSG